MESQSQTEDLLSYEVFREVLRIAKSGKFIEPEESVRYGEENLGPMKGIEKALYTFAFKKREAYQKYLEQLEFGGLSKEQFSSIQTLVLKLTNESIGVMLVLIGLVRLRFSARTSLSSKTVLFRKGFIAVAAPMDIGILNISEKSNQFGDVGIHGFYPDTVTAGRS